MGEVIADGDFYQFDDENAFEGLSYYRLKYLEQSGNWIYSETKAIFGQKKDASLVVYPNPTEGSIDIYFKDLKQRQKVRIQLFDAQGKLIYNEQNTVNRQNVLTIDSAVMMNSGVYWLAIQLEDGSQMMRKIIKK